MAINNISSLRMTGMMSGFDTDGIIKSLMQIEQLKMDRHVRARTTLQWKQQAINDIHTQLSDFRNKYTSLLSSENLMSESVYNAYKATVTGDDSAVSAQSTVRAKAGSVTIDKVIQLAQGGKAESSGKVSADGNFQLSANNDVKLGDLNFKNDIFAKDDDTVSFSINGQFFSFNKNNTLSDVINTVNSNNAAGVTMSYDRLTDGFKIETKKTGEGNMLNIQNIRGNAFGKDSAFGIDPENDITQGQNAKFVVGGKTAERDTNSFEADGVYYTLNRVTDKSVTIKIETDAQPAIDKIKGFVDAYNTLVGKLTGLVNERKSTDESVYKPLTDAEKAEMSETEIELWETIAKKGLMRRDSGLEKMLRDMRSALYEAVEGTGLSPSSIGLKTSSSVSGKQGQIELDEDKLRAALEKDPEKVMAVFTQTSSSSTVTGAYNKDSGLMNRITSIFNQYAYGSSTQTLTNLQNSIDTTNETISKMETRMKEQENRLYQKYAKMEEALSNMQSQSDWLTSLLSSGS